ncbi:MAG: hypothetical protein AABZ79_14980, partial [Pseudomonadota bacterium]
ALRPLRSHSDFFPVDQTLYALEKTVLPNHCFAGIALTRFQHREPILRRPTLTAKTLLDFLASHAHQMPAQVSKERGKEAAQHHRNSKLPRHFNDLFSSEIHISLDD